LVAASPGVISFAGGLPSPALFPRGILARSFLRAVRSPALQYGWPEGSEVLRRWVSERLRARGARIGPGEILITSGAQQAIDLATRLLCRRGDRIAVDAESYPGALDLFRSRGLQPSLTAQPVRYAMPAMHNPWGRAAAISPDGVVLEDDAYAELRFDGASPPTLLASARASVFHIGTFSKTLCPGLRVGWLVPPARWFRASLRLKRDEDLQSGGLAQAVLEGYLASIDWDARLARLRRCYARKAERLIDSLRRHLPGWRFREPEGGFSVWVEPDGEGSSTGLLRLAVEEGTSFDPGRSFRPSPVDRPLALRLCFSAVEESGIDEGVRRLARAWIKLQCRDPGRARIGRRRPPARVRSLRARPGARAATVDAIVAPVGRRSARRRSSTRIP
jgi:2-aminoadipate transaminase